MKKILSVLFASLIFLISTLSVYGAPPQSQEVMIYEEHLSFFSPVWSTRNINFRELPNLESEIYEVIPRGTQISAIGYDPNKEWTQVSYNGHIGFLYTSLLSCEYVDHYYYYYIDEWKPAELDEDLQRYAQDLLNEWGIGNYYPYFLCQAYQESRYDMNCIGRAHGGYCDYGIMQIWQGHEFDSNSSLYQVIKQNPDYKTDPYQNIYCGLYQMKLNIEAYGDYITAIGCYLTGNGTPSQTYINDVMSHWKHLIEK